MSCHGRIRGVSECLDKRPKDIFHASECMPVNCSLLGQSTRLVTSPGAEPGVCLPFASRPGRARYRQTTPGPLEQGTPIHDALGTDQSYRFVSQECGPERPPWQRFQIAKRKAMRPLTFLQALGRSCRSSFVMLTGARVTEDSWHAPRSRPKRHPKYRT